MQQPIVIQGRTIAVLNPLPTGVVFHPTYTDVPAMRASGKGGAAVLVDKISISYTCDGAVGGGTYQGNGTADIVASTPRVECEGKQMLTENDSVNVTCSGKVVTGSGSTPTPATATFIITDGVQKNADANKV